MNNLTKNFMLLLKDEKEAFVPVDATDKEIDGLECAGYSVRIVDSLTISINGPYHKVRYFLNGDEGEYLVIGNGEMYFVSFP